MATSARRKRGVWKPTSKQQKQIEEVEEKGRKIKGKAGGGFVGLLA